MTTPWTIVSIRDWPGTDRVPRGSSRFRTDYPTVKRLLAEELRRVRATQVTLGFDCTHDDINRSGELYANAKLGSSRVLLTFTRHVAGVARELRFPCWSYLGWQENMYAIAKTLEALLAVERYGATQQDEQWRGFARLGAGEGAGGGVNTQALALSPERAARILVEAHPTMGASTGTGLEVLARALLDRDATAGALKLAQESRLAAHPDRGCGGSDGLFATVNAAYEALRRYHQEGR